MFYATNLVSLGGLEFNDYASMSRLGKIFDLRHSILNRESNAWVYTPVPDAM